MARREPQYVFFPGVTPGWDNSPRRKTGANIFKHSRPEHYGRWLRHAVEVATRRYGGDERLVFINAWNEWAEGNHLEPVQRGGHAYLGQTLASIGARSR